jgi:hypothetical protein
MSDEPVTTRELIAGYRATERPSDAARDRMWRTVEARRARPVIAPPQRRRAPAIWLALAAALLLIGLSSYLLLQAQRDARVAPGNLLMAPRVVAPEDGVAAPIERAPRGEASESTTREPAAGDASTTAPDDASTTAASEPSSTAPKYASSTPGETSSTAPGDASRTAPREHASGPAPIVDHAPDVPPRRSTRPARPQIDPLLAELELIQRIKDALDAGRASEALARVEQHAREFARGSLAEEREALRVVALCGADELARAQRAQQAFLRAYPRSAYAERVRTACPELPGDAF